MSGIAVGLLALALTISIPAAVQERPPPSSDEHGCDIDLELAGQMRDILSNALHQGLRVEEDRVHDFLERAQPECANGRELLMRTAAEFGLSEAALTSEVERFRHVNCGPPTLPPLSEFARDVTLHVVLHELGHALVREFDLPVLGNEETMADAFATHYLTTHLPDRAPAVLRARVESLMFEAGEVPRAEWSVSGEHDSDARRAHKIAALAIAADRERYRGVAQAVGMSDDELRASRDYGSEIHRSWRRMLAPLWMPAGVPSNEARLVFDCGDSLRDDLQGSGLTAELEGIVRSFDWHSQVKIRFVGGNGGAAWSRSERTVNVHAGYLLRFIEQGRALAR